MEKIKASCGDPDLVLFCLSMDNTRWHSDDKDAIETVTHYLGKKIWENTVLVDLLTFADKRLPSTEAAFKERISDLETLFRKALLNVNVPTNHILQ